MHEKQNVLLLRDKFYDILGIFKTQHSILFLDNNHAKVFLKIQCFY